MASYDLQGLIITAHGEYPKAWVREGKITFVDPADSGAGVEPTVLTGYFIPGLVDVHAHIGLDANGGVSQEVALEQALTNRRTGVLLVRDAGVPIDNTFVQQRSDLPELIRCGRHLARPKRYLRGFSRDLDDVNEFPQAMEQEAKRSDGWVKIVADWIDRSNAEKSDLEPLWPADILQAGIAAAHAAGAKVMAHTFSHAAIGPLLEAGVDCIEHGTGMDNAHIAQAAERGIPVSPTLLEVALFSEFAQQGEDKFPVFAANMRQMWENRYEQVAAMYQAGVQLLPASDAGGGIPHGLLPKELAEWEKAGISPAEIIAFATWKARQYLGYEALEEGTSADLVGYSKDPRQDITQLENPKHVILRGASY